MAVNGLGKPFRKKTIRKIEKTVNIRVKLPHVNKEPLPRNHFFQTPFSHSTLKLERKKLTPQNHSSLFRSISCFGVTKITTPI